MDKNAKIIIKVSVVTIIVNIILLLLKAIFGFIFHNLAVISDAIHSATDVLTSVAIIIVSFFITSKADKKHNYGHEKIEPLFTLILAFFVGVVSIMLGIEGVKGVIAPKAPEINIYLIITVIISLLVKEGMFWYGIYNAKKIKSEMLRVNAWHNRSDSLSSVAVLIGLIFSNFTGTNIFESISVIIVAILILKVAIQISISAINQLIDKAADDSTCQKIKDIINQISGVKNIDSLKTRIFGNSIYADLEIAVDSKLSVDDSHQIAEKIQVSLESNEVLNIKHCTVHINPFKTK